MEIEISGIKKDFTDSSFHSYCIEGGCLSSMGKNKMDIKQNN